MVRVSKLIPSPLRVSVKPFRSARVSSFAKAGALFNLKLFIVKMLEEFFLLNVEK